MSKIRNLVLQNFKQFTDVNIEFKDGINLVIGQNGEGKSNMMEAIEICLNYITADQSIMSRNPNVSHTYISLKTTDADIKFALTGDKKQFFLNDKLVSPQALELQLSCNIISIKQLQAYKLATFSGQQLFQYFQNKATLQNYQQKMDNIQQQLKEIQQKRQQSKSLIDDFKTSIEELNHQVDEYQSYKKLKIQIEQIQYILEQNQLQQLEAEIYELLQQIQQQEQLRNEADTSQQQTMKKIHNISQTITSQNSQLVDQQVSLQNVMQIYQRLQQIADFKDVGNQAEISKQIKNYEVQIESKQKELEQLQFKIFKAQLQQNSKDKMTNEQRNELLQITQQLKQQQQQLNNDINTLEVKCEELQNEVQKLKGQLSIRQASKINNLVVQMDNAMRQSQKQEQNVQKAYNDLYQCYSKNQYIIMQELKKLNENKQLNGFIGFFGELIKTEQYLYVVLEQAGGHLLNQVVVDTTENAMALIRTIQDNSRTQPELCGCRVNILVLDQFSENTGTVSFQSQVQSQENARQLSSMITIRSKNQSLQNVINHYFDRVLVVETFELANQLSTQYNCDCYTIQGDSVLRSGLINAGDNGSIRVQRFDTLTKEIEYLNRAKMELQRLDQEIQTEQLEQSKITQIRQSLQQKQSELHNHESELNSLKTQCAELSKEISQNEFILNDSEKTSTQVTEQDIANLKKQSDELLIECNQIQEKQFQEQQKLENIQQIITQVTEMASYAPQLKFDKINYDEVTSKVRHFMHQCGQTEQEIVTSIQKLDQEKLEHERALSQQTAQTEAQAQNLQLLIDNLQNKQHQLGQLQRSARLMSSQLSAYALPEEIERNRNQKNFLQQKLQKLNHDMQELGDQNVVLYENVEEKQKQLAEVEADFAKFTQAEERILTLLNEIGKKHLNELDSNYHIVAKKFSDIFECLTNKTGKIILDLENQELTFDLDPSYGGKVNMNQLSGGQQTLVSLTLIMSLASLDNYNIYILDEVDSNLDLEVKKRFYAMLRQIVDQQNAQVIISSFRQEILPFINGNIIEVKNGLLRVLASADEIEEGILRSTEAQQ